jgi:hypothetical protein
MGPPPSGLVRADETLHRFEEKKAEQELSRKVGAISALRNHLPTMAARCERVSHIKEEANGHFKKGNAAGALQGYLTCIWLIKAGDPPLPESIVANAAPSGTTLMPMLGDGKEEEGSQPSSGCAIDPQVSQLRRTLHLNVAACALKLGDWKGAAAACDYVLAGEPSNPKALFRLARAYEGQRKLEKAEVAAAAVLKVDEGNTEARKLLEGIRSQLTQQKKMFGGLFERAKSEGGGSLYAEKDDWSEDLAAKRREDEEAVQARIERSEAEAKAFADDIKANARADGLPPWADLPVEERKYYEDLQERIKSGDKAAFMEAMNGMFPQASEAKAT